MRPAASYPRTAFRPAPAGRHDTLASAILDASALVSLLTGIWAGMHAFWGF